MDAKIYKVARIEGEYAILTDENEEGELFIALALLPIGADIGSKLLFENFSYELID